MTSHDFARMLLDMDDLPIAVPSPRGLILYQPVATRVTDEDGIDVMLISDSSGPVNPMMERKSPSFPTLVHDELERARELHPQPIQSDHEGIAVLREEYLEAEEEAFKKRDDRDRVALLCELVQVAVVARRFAEDRELTAPAIVAQYRKAKS